MWSCDDAHFRHFLDIVICKQQFLINQSILHSTHKEVKIRLSGGWDACKNGESNYGCADLLAFVVATSYDCTCEVGEVDQYNFCQFQNWFKMKNYFPDNSVPGELGPLPLPNPAPALASFSYNNRTRLISDKDKTNIKQQQYGKTDQYWQQSNRTENKLTHSILSV